MNFPFLEFKNHQIYNSTYILNRAPPAGRAEQHLAHYGGLLLRFHAAFFKIPVWKCCCWWGKELRRSEALWKKQMVFLLHSLLKVCRKTKLSLAAHQHLHSSNHEKCNNCMCRSCQKGCISSSLCMAEEINLACSEKKHLYLQDLWIRGDFLLTWRLRSKYTFQRSGKKLKPCWIWIHENVSTQGRVRVELVILGCDNWTGLSKSSKWTGREGGEQTLLLLLWFTVFITKGARGGVLPGTDRRVQTCHN